MEVHVRFTSSSILTGLVFIVCIVRDKNEMDIMGIDDGAPILENI